MTGVLAIQRELGTAIARHVELQLSEERLAALAHRQTPSAEAYDLYLRGRYFWNQLSPASMRRAIEYYGRATELDPHYALAWSGLADVYATSPITGDVSPLQVWSKARRAVAHAMEAASDLAETQTSLGFLKFWLDWDWVTAESAFRQAILINPSYALAHRMLGIVLSHICRREESNAAAKRARELDPLNVTHQALSAQIAFAAGDYELAAQLARQAIAIDPAFWIGFFQLGQAYEQLGRFDSALDALSNAWRLSGGNSKPISLRGYILAKLGKTQDARELLSTLEAVGREQYVPPYSFALVHAGFNQAELALQFLERAHDAHDVHLVYLTMDPKWEPFRANPQFIQLLDRCGFQQSARI